MESHYHDRNYLFSFALSFIPKSDVKLIIPEQFVNKNTGVIYWKDFMDWLISQNGYLQFDYDH